MPKDVHAIAGRGVADLEEAVLSLLQTARTNREELGPAKIGARAGIPEVPDKQQEIVTGILHLLHKKGKVCHCYRGVWTIADHTHE